MNEIFIHYCSTLSQYFISHTHTHTHSVSFDGIQSRKHCKTPHLLPHYNVKTTCIIPKTKVVSQARLLPQRVWPARLEPRCPKQTHRGFAVASEMRNHLADKVQQGWQKARKTIPSFCVLSPHTFSMHAKYQYDVPWAWWICVWNKIHVDLV